MFARVLDAYSRTILPPVRGFLEEIDRRSVKMGLRQKWALRLAAATLVLPILSPEILRSRNDLEILGSLIFILEIFVSWVLHPFFGPWSFTAAVFLVVSLSWMLGFFGVREPSSSKSLGA